MSDDFSNRRFRNLLLEYQHVFVLLVPPVVMTALVVTQGWNGGTFWIEYWWIFFVALIGATIANTVGISGSALFVPFFIFIFPLFAPPLSPETLVKVGLITESFGLSSSALAFARYGLIDYKMGIVVVLGAVPFVVGGSILSFLIPAWVFYTLLGILLIVSAILVGKHDSGHSISDGSASDGDNRVEADGRDDDGENVSKDDLDGNTYAYSRSGYLGRFGNYGAGGVFQGLAGFGIGEIGIIAMLRSNIPVRVAIGTNHIVVALTAIIASITHVTQSAHLSTAPTPWNIIFMTVPGVVIGGQLAPYVAARLPADRLQQGIAVLFLVLSLALFGLAAF